MAVFCIPKHLVEKLKNSALKGEVNIKELYNMSSAERREHFTKFTDPELGKFINVEFEKAMVSKQKTALTDWAKGVFSPEAKAQPHYKNVLDKINSLDDLGVLSPKNEQVFLQDLVAEKLGITVSAEEVRQIAERAKKIDEAQLALGTDLGNPLELQKNLDYFVAKKAMDDYLLSLSPSSRLKVLTGTIGRGMMLASVKSPILNIGSNAELAITEGLSRRFASGQFRGANTELAKSYVKFINQIYQKTGYDLSRMRHLSDSGASGARVLDDIVTTQGPGRVRRAGRIVEDIVFKQLMGAPDVAFSSTHFADSLNLASLKLANGDKNKATAMMQDAMRIVPQTPEGEILREQAIMDAEMATWTNSSWATKVTLGIRKLINEISGDLRLGDQIMPFVKTPANVIETGLDYAGLGFPKAVIDTVNAFRSGDLGTREFRLKVSRDLVRAGLGLLMSALIAAQLDDDDFVGAYDPARKQIEDLRNSRENSIRVGNRWISTDWLGPLAVGVSAIMYARKNKGSGLSKTKSYLAGAGSTLLQLPGVSDVQDVLKDYQLKQGMFGGTMEATDSFMNWIYSRLAPSFIGDLAKATDEYERKTGSIGSRIQARIPGLRQKLPVKKTIFADEMKTESGLTTILFGARVKTNRETAVIKELQDVQAATGKSINFTDWDKSSSSKITQFKESHSEADFENAKSRYGYWIKTKIEEALNDDRYKQLSPEEKVEILNSLDTKAIDKVFSQFNFKYKASSQAKDKTKFEFKF